jgi:hypothetical protein
MNQPPQQADATPSQDIPEDVPARVKPLYRLFRALLAEGVSPDLALATARDAIGPLPPRILTPEEFAAVVNRSLITVQEWARRGDVPAIRATGPRGRKQLVGFHLETALKALTQ